MILWQVFGYLRGESRSLPLHQLVVVGDESDAMRQAEDVWRKVFPGLEAFAQSAVAVDSVGGYAVRVEAMADGDGAVR